MIHLSSKWLIACCALCLFSCLPAQTNLEVEGMGFFGNRGLKERLAFLQNLDPTEPAELSATLIEDSAFLLIEQLKRDGRLNPTVRAEIATADQLSSATWTTPYNTQLPLDVTADQITFTVDPGTPFYYDDVQIQGVPLIADEALQRYFIPGGVLINTKKARMFTQENLNRRIGRVLRTLNDQGFRKAKIVSQEVDQNPETGAVSVHLKFDQGPQHQVGNVTVSIDRDDKTQETSIEIPTATPLTQEWERTQRSSFRAEAYEAGYPDARVSLEFEPLDPEGDKVMIYDVRIISEWGPLVTLDEVSFTGDPKTRTSVLKRQADLDSGAPLNRSQVSEARRKLMGLGIYKDVDLSYAPPTGVRRAVDFSLTPSVRQELELLAGWGSYEQLRAGFKWERRNPFGRAHRYALEAKQSFKASQTEATYSIPQAFGTSATLYGNVEYSFREEISFERTRQGGAIGITSTNASGLRLGLEYGFFQENADRDDTVTFLSREDASIGSLTLSATYDQRNDFLMPSSGWSAFGEIEIASQLLGSSVGFQKLELGGSYHFAISKSTVVHMGVRTGSLFADGDAETNIPFNKRFFNGGENTVRGYREGGASPLDSNGDQVGAESYALLNLEIEQRFYSKFSTVVFLDTLVNSRQGFFEDVNQPLYTLGIGLRYQTVVGPIRAEYGHNLNPREDDPNGSFHFSIGFPF
jgi:outer membrane protein assembly factor BamA